MIGTVEICCFRIQQNQLQVLLQKRRSEPFINLYGLPGGGISPEQDKDITDTVSRILLGRTQLVAGWMEQVETVANNQRDPRAWSICCSYLTLIDSQQKVTPSCKWINVFDLLNSAVRLAFDHENLIRNALSRLQNKTRYTSLPIWFLKGAFTLPELQQVYENILGTQLPKAAFRRRLNRPDIMQETGGKDRSQNRPAALYTMTESHQLVYFEQLMKGS